MRQSERRTRLETFIEKANLVHSDEDLDYSKSRYVNNRTKILVIDHDLRADGTEYGEYWVTPANHLKGESHPQKMIKKKAVSKGVRTEKMIRMFKEIYPDELFDYSEVRYRNLNTKICIIDRSLNDNGKEKGEFWITPKDFLKGNLVLKKGKIRYEPPMAEEEIIYEMKRRCPGIRIIQNDHSVLSKKEIDIYLPEQEIGIEYNGLQWHTEWAAGRKKSYHIGKTTEALLKNVKLIHVFESDYVKSPSKIIDSLIHKANLDNSKPKIYARKCKVKEISYKKAKKWASEHNWNLKPSLCSLALCSDNIIFAIMTFSRVKGNDWELLDYLSNPDYIVSGTASKLFCHFVRKYKPNTVKTSVSIEYTPDKENNVFTKIGFRFIEQTSPDYGYFKRSAGPIIQDKDAIIQQVTEKYGNKKNKSETQIAKQMGYDRIWNCGKYVYLWKNDGI